MDDFGCARTHPLRSGNNVQGYTEDVKGKFENHVPGLT
jgi:hypothetical protein